MMYEFWRSEAGAHLSIGPITLGLFSLAMEDDAEQMRQEGKESQELIGRREELARLLLLFSDAGAVARVSITNGQEEEGKAKRHYLDTGDVSMMQAIYRRGGDE